MNNRVLDRDWRCGQCGNNNFARRTHCHACGSPQSSQSSSMRRGGAAYTPGHRTRSLVGATATRAGGGAVAPVPVLGSVERRYDKSDGRAYTHAEFIKFYGGHAEWNRAAPAGNSSVSASPVSTSSSSSNSNGRSQAGGRAVLPSLANIPDAMEIILSCPAHCIGSMIGSGGSIIKDLQIRSQCVIQIDQDRPAGAARPVIISGKASNIEVARDMVEDIIGRGDPDKWESTAVLLQQAGTYVRGGTWPGMPNPPPGYVPHGQRAPSSSTSTTSSLSMSTSARRSPALSQQQQQQQQQVPPDKPVPPIGSAAYAVYLQEVEKAAKQAAGQQLPMPPLPLPLAPPPPPLPPPPLPPPPLPPPPPPPLPPPSSPPISPVRGGIEGIAERLSTANIRSTSSSPSMAAVVSQRLSPPPLPPPPASMQRYSQAFPLAPSHTRGTDTAQAPNITAVGAATLSAHFITGTNPKSNAPPADFLSASGSLSGNGSTPFRLVAAPSQQFAKPGTDSSSSNSTYISTTNNNTNSNINIIDKNSGSNGNSRKNNKIDNSNSKSTKIDGKSMVSPGSLVMNPTGNLSELLRSQGYERYVKCFEQEDVDMEAFLMLTSKSELIDIGVTGDDDQDAILGMIAFLQVK